MVLNGDSDIIDIQQIRTGGRTFIQQLNGKTYRAVASGHHMRFSTDQTEKYPMNIQSQRAQHVVVFRKSTTNGKCNIFHNIICKSFLFACIKFLSEKQIIAFLRKVFDSAHQTSGNCLINV